MIIDEAIKHAEEVAEEHTKYNRYGGFESCDECAEEHRQLAEWLKDYKRLLEQDPVLDKIRAEIIQIVNEEKLYDKKWTLGLRYAVNIIDKYRVKSEDVK